MAHPTPDSFPLRIEVDFPERLSRRRLLLKGVLGLPDAWYATRVLLTGWPLTWRARGNRAVSREEAEQLIGRLRVGVRYAAYAQYGLCDVPPPRTTEHVQSYPVRLCVDLPPGLDSDASVVIKANATGLAAFAMLPQMLAMIGATSLAFFAVLASGRYPRGLFDFVVKRMAHFYGGSWIILQPASAGL